MLEQTKGIVFRQIKYSETSVIVHIYTEKYGLHSFIIKGVRSKKGKGKSALLQPLTLLDIVAYHKPKSELSHIKELRLDQPYHTIGCDIIKNTIALFITEVLIKTIKGHQANPSLFQFLYHALQGLDLMESHVSLFAPWFMLHLTKHLGLQPSGNYSTQTPVFNLTEGYFDKEQNPQSTLLPPDLSMTLHLVNNSSFTNLHQLNVAKPIRTQLLDAIIQYYQLHIPDFKSIQSINILHTILS